MQPAVPNNSNSLPRNTDEIGKVKKEIVSVATKDEPEKHKVDTGYGKDIKGNTLHPAPNCTCTVTLQYFQIYPSQCLDW